MVATITQRISLEGADDIKKKLQDLGKAGEQAFKQIQDAAAKPITDPARIDQARQAFNNLTTAAQQAGDAIQTAGQQAQTAGEQAGRGLQTAAIRFGLAAGAIVTAISAVVRSLISGAGETAQKIQDQADNLGLTVEQWITLRRSIDAAGNSFDDFVSSAAPLIKNLNQLGAESGRSFQTFANGAQVTTLTMGKLSDQSKQLLAVLEKFGVRRDIIDKGSLATMQELARIIDGMPEGSAKAAAGVQFFGAKWRDTVADLRVGAKAVGDTASELDNMRRASREMTPEQRAAAQSAKDAWDDFGRAIEAVKNKIGAFFAPSSGARAKWLADMVDDARLLLQTWSRLDEAGRTSFLANLDEGPAQTAFKVLVALSQQLAGLWTDVLVPAGKSVFGVFESIAGVFQGITGSQVAAFFITAAIAVGGFVLALKTLSLLLTPLTLLFSPFGAALAAAAVAAALFWDKIAAGAKEVAALIPVELQDIADSFKKLLAGDFSGFWDQFSTAAVAAFDKIRKNASDTNWVRILLEIISQLPGAIETVAKAFIALGVVAQKAADAINAVFGTKLTGTDIAALLIVTQLIGGFGALAVAINLAGQAFGVLVALFGGPWAAVIVAGIVLLIRYWDDLKSAMQSVMDFFDALAAKGNAFRDGVIGWAGSVWSDFANAATAAINTVIGALDALWEKIKAIGSAIAGVFSGGGGEPGSVTPAPGNARGGLIGGRGSGTSDSNLSWVSRGEHIMPAAAVQQPGVLAFLEALRRSGGDLSHVLNGMGRFASGGLVSSMPALASAGGGGSNRNLGTLTLALPDGTTVSGLTDERIADALRRVAVNSQIRSGGRKPSRYT